MSLALSIYATGAAITALAMLGLVWPQRGDDLEAFPISHRAGATVGAALLWPVLLVQAFRL